MKHTIKCYFQLVGAYIKSSLVTRWSLLAYTVSIMSMYISSFLGLWIIMNKFQTINSWTYGEVAFIYIISLMSYGMRNVFFIQFRRIGILVKEGTLDQVLVRPMNPFVYIMGSRFEIGGFGHILFGIVLLIILKNEIGIVWTLTNIIYFVLTLISATLVQGAVTILIGTMAFFLTETKGLDAVYNGFREFIWYPVSLYNSAIKIILFTIIPLAFVSYVPAGIFLKNQEYAMLPSWVWQVSLLVGGIFFGGAYSFWKYGLKNYKSTGS